MTTRWGDAKVKCEVCGRIFEGRVPPGGDGSALRPAPHKGPDKKLCEGRLFLAEEVRLDQVDRK